MDERNKLNLQSSSTRRIFFSRILFYSALALPLLITNLGWAQNNKIRSCGARPEIFDDANAQAIVKVLPKSVFVGRTADVWIESKELGIRIWARHNFKTGSKVFVCADLPRNSNQNFSVPMLVLYDRTDSKSMGDSLWQIQIMMQGQRLGLWSQKSSLLNVEEALRKGEFHFSLMDEYQLHSTKKADGFEVQSVIRYDQFKN